MTQYGDPTTMTFWEAAERRELMIQRCTDCGTHQFYPRPFCTTCESDSITWVRASGGATVYTQTTIRRKVVEGLEPPYVVAIVHLDEGPHLISNIVGGECPIGSRVTLTWRERPDAPPLPVFRPAST